MVVGFFFGQIIIQSNIFIIYDDIYVHFEAAAQQFKPFPTYARGAKVKAELSASLCPCTSKRDQDGSLVRKLTNTYFVNINSHMLHGAGIFTYIWVIFRANVGKYSIHGAYGDWNMNFKDNITSIFHVPITKIKIA